MALGRCSVVKRREAAESTRCEAVVLDCRRPKSSMQERGQGWLEGWPRPGVAAADQARMKCLGVTHSRSGRSFSARQHRFRGG